MRKIGSVSVMATAIVLLTSSARFGRVAPGVAPGGVVIQHDSAVARREQGPHNGGGETTAYPFFTDEKGLALVFRKRALHPGAAIGYHRNDADEIYYVLSGRGELTVDGVRHEVGPGTAILTRPGSSHGLRQVGNEDLVILINYLNESSTSSAETGRSIFTDTALYRQVCAQADSGVTPAAGRCTPRDQGVRRRKP
jgi:mannose-6-phosphate isomerase-like protein (cupin superfamily)